MDLSEDKNESLAKEMKSHLNLDENSAIRSDNSKNTEKNNRTSKNRAGGKLKKDEQDAEKTQQDQAALLLTHDKCTFWLVDKNRFCRLKKIRGHNLCGEHMPKEEVILNDGKKRILCPLDNTHTCFEHLLNKHMKKCNSARKDSPVFIDQDVNLCDPVQFLQRSRIFNNFSQLNLDDYEGKEMQNLNDDEFSDFTRKIVSFYLGNVPDIQNRFGSHPLILKELVRSDIGDNAAKHLAQNGSIINLLETQGLLKNHTCFIEYGSGRGGLTYHIAQAVLEKGLTDCSFVLVDTTSPRHKLDNKLKDSGLKVDRVRANIRDLVVGELPFVKSDCTIYVVGVAKHLCGNATDMALYSLFNPLGSAFNKVEGAVFATCCHHRCDSDSYVGMSSFKLGGNKVFIPGELKALSQMAAWGTNGDVTSQIDKEKVLKPDHIKFYDQVKSGLEPSIYLKLTVGCYIKEILDWGRAKYISNSTRNLFYAEVINFVDKTTTLENKAIIACRLTEDHKKKYENIKERMEDRWSEIQKVWVAAGMGWAKGNNDRFMP